MLKRRKVSAKDQPLLVSSRLFRTGKVGARLMCKTAALRTQAILVCSINKGARLCKIARPNAAFDEDLERFVGCIHAMSRESMG